MVTPSRAHLGAGSQLAIVHPTTDAAVANDANRPANNVYLIGNRSSCSKFADDFFSFSKSYNKQESCAIAKMTAQCALYMVP